MNRAVKGNRKEVRTAALLEEAGWTVGSRRHIAGPGDLLAVKVGVTPLLVEVKMAGSPYMNFRRGDRAAMLEYALERGLDAALAWWRPRARAHELIPSDDWPR